MTLLERSSVVLARHRRAGFVLLALVGLVGGGCGGGSARDDPENGGLIAFHVERDDEASDIYVVSAEGGGERRLTRTGKDIQPAWSPDGELDMYPSWSPDGSRILFTRGSADEYDLYEMKADGTTYDV